MMMVYVAYFTSHSGSLMYVIRAEVGVGWEWQGTWTRKKVKAGEALLFHTDISTARVRVSGMQFDYVTIARVT